MLRYCLNKMFGTDLCIANNCNIKRDNVCTIEDKEGQNLAGDVTFRVSELEVFAITF